MHLVEAAYGVDFPAVFKRIPRPERWQLGDVAIGLDSLDTGLIWPDKYARTCDKGPRGQPSHHRKEELSRLTIVHVLPVVNQSHGLVKVVEYVLGHIVRVVFTPVGRF